MVASEIKDLKNGAIVNLGSNARSMVLEVALDGANSAQVQISHDKTTWHNLGTAISADGLLSYDDSNEHFLQYVKIVVDESNGAAMGANGKLNLYLGRSK
tara:strand:- start:1911 stop:2210 length:300 start_codon:yes stop_codon:yes gene_type:complete